MSLVSEIIDRIPQRPVRLVSVVCATTAVLPALATFYIDGSSVAVPCRIQAGSTFSSGQSGMAYWAAPSLPICFKTN